jgi:hypothetical protein
MIRGAITCSKTLDISIHSSYQQNSSSGGAFILRRSVYTEQAHARGNCVERNVTPDLPTQAREPFLMGEDRSQQCEDSDDACRNQHDADDPPDSFHFIPPRL